MNVLSYRGGYVFIIVRQRVRHILMAKIKSKTQTELSLTAREEEKKPVPGVSSPVTWSIRKVEFDSRRVIEKAAERCGKTLGQYLNEDVRSFSQGQITQTQLPASPKDIQNQIDYLTKMVEDIATKMPDQGKKSLWKRLFF